MFLFRIASSIIALHLFTSPFATGPLPFNIGSEGEDFGSSGKESIGLSLSSSQAALYDPESDTFLFEKDGDRLVPLASLTKLMTAIVFLESGPNLNMATEILPEEDRIGGKVYLYQGETVLVKDLFFASLVGSANNATVAMVRSSGMSEEEFIKRMNQKAEALGLQKTVFFDETGLNPKNVSTAKETAKMIHAALSFPEIQKAIQRSKYEFSTLNTNAPHTIRNTNDLLMSFLNESPFSVLGGKTGYLDEAGYCLALAVKREDGKVLIAAVLGSPSSDARFLDAKGLIYWGFQQLKS